jgi:hypothetical protein
VPGAFEDGTACQHVSIPSAIDHQLAEVRAREATGVFEVENSLAVAR